MVYPDCLHCVLWPVINRFCEEHPDGSMNDVFCAIADVLGDMIAHEPPGERLERIEYIGRRLEERFNAVLEMKKGSSHG
jgi:hypothetical protein